MNFSSHPQAGNKDALRKSAEYPLDFGLAIAALVPARSSRPRETNVDLDCYQGEDTLGSLDDLIVNRKRCWWRRL